MTLSLFFWSNTRGPGGLTDSSVKGLGFPNKYQYVPPAHITSQAKRISSHIVEIMGQWVRLMCDLSVDGSCSYSRASEYYCPYRTPLYAVSQRSIRERRELDMQWC